MAIWNDFTLAEEVTSNAWGTISSSQVQKHSLIIAYAAHYDSGGSAPRIRLSGVQHRIIGEFPSTPYRSWYPYYWYYWYYYYYGYYPPYWWLYRYYRWWWYRWWYGYWWWYYHGYWYVTANVVIAVADEAGTISMEALGNVFRAQKLRVFTSNLSTDADKEVVQVSFQRSNTQPVRRDAYRGDLKVLTDDLVVLHGVDLTPNYYQNTLALSGPATQTLLDEFVTYAWPYGGVRTRIVRIKGDGVLSYTWQYANAGVTAIRLTPNVVEKTVSFPTVSGYVFFEMQLVEDPLGNVSYPREFLSLVKKLKNSEDWGIFRAWKREDVQKVEDTSGNEVFTGWKRVEIWAVPNDYYTDVQAIPDALVLEDLQKLHARVTYHEERWG